MNQQSKSEYKLNIESEGDYYIAIHRGETYGNAATINITLQFKRRVYDFTKTTEHCKASVGKPCSVPLRYATSERTVIEVPMTYKELSIPEAVKVEWNCEARVWFYFVLYGSIYMLLSLLVAVIYKLTQGKDLSRYFRRRKDKKQLICTVKYGEMSGPRASAIDANNTGQDGDDRQGRLSRARLSDTISFQSIAKYHNWALEDDEFDEIHQRTNGQLDTSQDSSSISKATPTGIAAIYREPKHISSSPSNSQNLITKYLALKPRASSELDTDHEITNNSEEVLLSWPHDSVPRSTDKSAHFHHTTLKPTRSTGYFRVYSPMTQQRTGSVAGRRELRSPNPIFYRPGSQLSSSKEEVILGPGIEV